MNENENANTNAVEPLLKRVSIFLETEDWIKAGQYCERVLDMEPENARAYMGKLMAELHVSKQEDLSACEEPFDDNKNYKLALTYADEELKKTLEGYNKAAAERMEENRLAQSYQDGIHAMEEAVYEEDFHKAAQIFRSIINYKSAEELAEECDRGFEKRVAEADRIIERYQNLKQMSDEAGRSELTEIKKKISDIKIWSIVVGDETRWPVFFDDPEFFSMLCEESCVIEKLPVKTLLKWKIEHGHEIFFGTGPQWDDSSHSYVTAPIHWDVLEKKDDKALLLGYPVGIRDFGVWYGWGGSHIRTYLMRDFYRNSFTEEEREIIMRVPIRCSYTTMGFFHDKPHTEDEEDWIFILSKEELFQYFGNNFKQPPINKYSANVTRTDVSGWWLRDTAQCYDGAIKGGAAAVVTMWVDRTPEINYVLATKRCMVRPALWIDLSE